MPKSEDDDDERQKSSEHGRVREASVPPKIPVRDSEAKPNHIEVRYYGTYRTNHPNAFGNLPVVKASANSKSHNCMRR